MLTEHGAAPDVASLAAGLGTALHAAGLPVGPDRCERLAGAVTVMGARTLTELRACALATLVSDPSQMSTFERVWSELFGTPAALQELLASADVPARPADQDGGPPAPHQGDPSRFPSGLHLAVAGSSEPNGDDPVSELPAVHRVASAAERLRERDFTELSVAELQQLVALMREMTLSVPLRRTRRYRGARAGKRPDLRATLRQARRSGGEPIRLSRRAPRARPRRLVVLCDISGSMESYARALLMLMYCLNGGQLRGGQSRPEVFSFATRLTRLTPTLAAASPDT
ncbi:MAG TPA: VWA domain-containing protein, partial [Streptosporangiaceae bacterium]